MAEISKIRPGIYNIEYFTASQAALYIGDILIDEITGMSFSVQQSRRPLYGYADQFFKAVSKGQVLVQGWFSVNFKEAGYLWLVLKKYKEDNSRKSAPFTSTSEVFQQNIEAIVNGEVSQDYRTSALKTLEEAYASLAGFESVTRAANLFKKDKSGREYRDVGIAENAFEEFENQIWGNTKEQLLSQDRRCDDVDLNPFDIYLSYGDFVGDDSLNHTIVRLVDVHIVGTSQQVEMDNMPIQEVYQFIARTKV